MSVETSVRVPALINIATRLRIDSVRSTSEAGSGHPSTCCSAAEIVAALFFAEMRYDPRDPQNPDNDRFVLSKGHGAPILYAAWAEVGFLKREDLLTLRQLDSDLEGHPTPRLPFVDVGTGSLGQGLAAGVGIALNARRINSDYRTYVLLGDGESAEGSVWEAASVAVRLQARLACVALRTSMRSARVVQRSGSTIRSRLPHAGAHSAGTSSRWTATTSWRFSTRSIRRGRPAAGRR